ERLSAGLAEAAGLLNDDDSSAMSRLHRAARLLRDLARLDPAFAVPADSVDGAGALVEDALAAVRALREGVMMAPGRLEAVDERPLARIASGGELSRTMLALKAILARADRVPTMIFDEVDSGIGGRVAAVVAQKLAAAAEGRQVLCVTHLAPIAARAVHHVRV